MSPLSTRHDRANADCHVLGFQLASMGRGATGRATHTSPEFTQFEYDTSTSIGGIIYLRLISRARIRPASSHARVKAIPPMTPLQLHSPLVREKVRDNSVPNTTPPAIPTVTHSLEKFTRRPFNRKSLQTGPACIHAVREHESCTSIRRIILLETLLEVGCRLVLPVYVLEHLTVALLGEA